MEKKEIREHFKQKRRELSPNELESRSELVCALLFKNFQLSEKTISLFLPIERQRELNTYLILEKGISLDAKIALPKMNPETQTLRHVLFESHSQLEVNSLGIPEPKSGKNLKLKDLEYVLVPLLAFDKYGNRVGYGKGYYDKFLRKCSPTCVFIGLSLFDEEVEISNVEKHDIRLHYCITPNQLIRFDER
jgi:5-formyltetrahydrofolate cyclo-ligase